MIYDKNAAADISRAEERTTLETTTMTLQSFISRCTTKMNAFFWLSNSKHSFRNQYYSSVLYYVPRAKAISFHKYIVDSIIINNNMIVYEDNRKSIN